MAWIDAGASHVIVTSWLFDDGGRLLEDHLVQLVNRVGKERVVIDLSCRRVSQDKTCCWRVAMNRWQTLTEISVNPQNLERLARYADEFLIHAADVEGLCNGIDVALVEEMGNWGKIPLTYAGGVSTLADVELVQTASQGKVDVTVGSALDLFGGDGVDYRDLVRWNHDQEDR